MNATHFLKENNNNNNNKLKFFMWWLIYFASESGSRSRLTYVKHCLDFSFVFSAPLPA